MTTNYLLLFLFALQTQRHASHSFIQQIYIKHLLCAYNVPTMCKTLLGDKTTAVKKRQGFWPSGTSNLVVETDNT